MQEIAKSVMAMGELYGRRFTPAALKLFLAALRPYDPAEIHAAIHRAIRKSRFCPSPAEIIAEIPHESPQTPPPADLQETRRQRDRRAELAHRFLDLTPEEQAVLRRAFLDQTNRFNRRRARNANAEQLSKNLAFRIFLETREEPAAREETP